MNPRLSKCEETVNGAGLWPCRLGERNQLRPYVSRGMSPTSVGATGRSPD